MPTWWWVLYGVGAAVVWAMLVLAFWIALAECFFAVDRRRRRQRERARGAADVLFIDRRRAS